MRFLNIFLVFQLLSLNSFAAEQQVRADGSSTVFPITEAVAEEFQKVNPKIRVVVGSSGTGGGFKKFALGEIDINNASRKIKDTEASLAKEKGIQFVEIPVAHDGITMVVNQKNTWVDKLTVDELKKMWEPGSKIVTWKDLRPEWPDRKIRFYGPGTDSGTFDFFTEAINGKAQSSRADFTKSEDDNVLVQGVAGDLDSLGYFGFAYYKENKTRMRAIPIDAGSGAVLPSEETIKTGKYKPLSRTVFIYVSSLALKKAQVNEFVNFYIDKAGVLAAEVGYVSMDKEKYSAAKKTYAEAITKAQGTK